MTNLPSSLRASRGTVARSTGQIGRRRASRGRRLAGTAAVLGLLVGTLMAAPAYAAETAESVLVQDDFARTVSGGWGAATAGGAYTSRGASNLSVDGGAGVVALGAGVTASSTLGAVSSGDASMKARLTFATLPAAGNGTYSGVALRVAGDSGYRLTLRVAARGSMDVALERTSGSATTTLTRKAIPFAASTDRPLDLTLAVSGTSSVALSGTVAVAGDAAQSTSISAADTSQERLTSNGAPAVWNYQSSSSGSNTVRWDSVTVTAPTSATPTPTPTSSPSATPSSSPSASPTPTGSPTPQPTPVATPTGGGSQSATEAGSMPVGTASYAVPDGALFVSTTGSDAAAGTRSAPLRTIAAAVNKAALGATIVIRGGSYNESLMINRGKRLTIQPYPAEAVWLDGSVPVSGWSRSGATWSVSGWTTKFDSSPTHARGKPDNTTPAWRWVNSAYPMAAHPDQVWIDGVAQSQVGSLQEVKANTFYVDYATNRIYLGSDPSGKQVRASNLQIAMTMLNTDSTVRGIGIRRYAPSVPDLGAVRLFGTTNITLKDLVITENATLGLSISGANTVLSHVTASHNGQMGIGSNRAVGMTVDSVLIDTNNTEHFNSAPSAGGFKFSRAKDVTVRNSVFRDNFGNGMWFDESSTGVTVASSDFVTNDSDGLVFELSADVRAVNNVIRGNVEAGILVLDTSQIALWNNSISGGQMGIRVDDGPRSSKDSKDPSYDGAGNPVTWETKDVVVKNNVVGNMTQMANGANWCGLVCITDSSGARKTAAQMNAALDGNVYYRAGAGDLPAATIRWANGTAGVANYRTAEEFRAATGQERTGKTLVGLGQIAKNGTLASGGTMQGVGVAIPDTIARAGGLVVGSATVGAIR